MPDSLSLCGSKFEMNVGMDFGVCCKVPSTYFLKKKTLQLAEQEHLDEDFREDLARPNGHNLESSFYSNEIG